MHFWSNYRQSFHCSLSLITQQSLSTSRKQPETTFVASRLLISSSVTIKMPNVFLCFGLCMEHRLQKINKLEKSNQLRQIFSLDLFCGGKCFCFYLLLCKINSFEHNLLSCHRQWGRTASKCFVCKKWFRKRWTGCAGEAGRGQNIKLQELVIEFPRH